MIDIDLITFEFKQCIASYYSEINYIVPLAMIDINLITAMRSPKEISENSQRYCLSGFKQISSNTIITQTPRSQTGF